MQKASVGDQVCVTAIESERRNQKVKKVTTVLLGHVSMGPISTKGVCRTGD